MKQTLFALALSMLAACGTESPSAQSQLAESRAPVTTPDEYDPNSMTRVTGWSIEQTFWFHDELRGQPVLIKNVDAVEEFMQIYIGSGRRSRFHVYVLVAEDLGNITNRLSVIDRLQPNRVRADKAYFMERSPAGNYVYRVSLPAQAPFRHEIYAELRGHGQTHWSNEGRPGEFAAIEYARYRSP